MGPSHPHHIMRPSPSTAAIFVDTISSGKDYVTDFVSSIDVQKLLPLAAFAATLGLGTAAFYFGQQHRPDLDDTLSSSQVSSAQNKKSKSKIPKKRNKKSNRVVFQNPLENDPMVAEFVDEEDSSENLTVAGDEVQNIKSDVEETIVADKLDEPIIDENNNVTTAAASTQDNILILKQCPRGRKTPCIAPFPLKLETFLRVHKLKYELDFNGHEPRIYGSPWIRFNTEDITDSQNVLHFLMDQYNLKVERELTDEQRGVATAYTHLLENHLYWGIALWRWVYDGARSLKDIQLLPKKTQNLIPDVCKTVEQAAWFHGIGKMSPMEVQRAVLQDIKSLSEFLGQKEYFLNTDIPTELDCTAFGMLAQFLWNMHGPFHDALVGYKNLTDFCWRIRLSYWPDWEECLNNTQFYTDDPYPTADLVKYPY